MTNHLKRFVAIVSTIALTLAVAGCGGNDDPASTDPPAATETPATPDTPGTTDPGPPAADDIPVVAYFVRGDELVAPVRRYLPGDFSVPMLEGTLNAWLAGPTAEELAAGYGTTVPPDTRLLSASYEMGDTNIVTVDLSAEFASGGGTAMMQARLAELVMTAATQVGLFDGLVLLIEGEQVTEFSGEGLVIDGPLTIDDVEASLPAILQHSVLAGDETAEGKQIAGWADVYEGTVSVQVVTDDGQVIYDTYTTATCGSGCRGKFVTWLGFEGYTGPATLRLFEVSPDDASETYLVEVPFTVV